MSVRKRFWSLVLALGCVGSSAWASPPALNVQGPAEGCPSPRGLIVELKRLLPQTRFETTPDADAEAVLIEDAGESFSVSVGGETRRFEDASRTCAERARLAAVFVALVLDPLHVPFSETKQEPPEPPPEPPKPPPPEPAPPPPPEPEPPSDEATIDFEIGPLLWVGAISTSENLPVAGGLGGRFRFGGAVAISLGGAGLLPAHLQYGEGDVEAIWTPFDVALRLGQRLGEWELAGELGPLAAWVSIAGQGVLDARAATRLEVGGRVGASVRYWASPNIALFAAGHGVFFPRPYHLELAGLGEIGRTPTLWVGTTIGAVIDLD